MVIALEKDDGSLFLFSSISEAEAEFEAIDVENGEYEFCDDTGQQFVAEMIELVRAFRAGSYRLQPHGAPDREHVSRLIARATCLARGAAKIQSIDDLRRRYSGRVD
jgi:hypothetical protein